MEKTAMIAIVSRGQDAKQRPNESAQRLVLDVLTCLALSFLFVPSALAGGLYVSEFSTTSQANAGAGRGAWVPDASATLHNPAAMTRLDDHGFATGFSAAIGNIRFDTDSSSANTGNGGNQSGVAPIASFSYVHRVSDRVRFGLTFFSLSGSILDPNDGWAGRFEVTELSLLTISITPTLAVRVTDWLSIGGGPIASYGVLNWNLKVNVLGPTERSVKLKDLDDWEPAGRVGILLHPRKDFSLSVYYNSKTDFDLSGDTRLPAGFSPNLDLQLPLAQFIEVSAHWQVSDKWALLATFDWEDWSEADNLKVTLPSRSINATTGFKDTYKIGVGANYQIAADWLLQTGLMFDTSALQNKNRTTGLPIDQQIRFAFGAQHDLNEKLTLGMSFEYINLGQGEVRQSTVRGDYEHNDIFVFGVTLAFKSLPWSGKASFN